MAPLLRWLPLFAALAACASSPSSSGSSAAPSDASTTPDVTIPDSGSPDAAQPEDLDLRIEGWFPRAMHRTADGWVALLDAPVRLTEAWGRPKRAVALMAANGQAHKRLEPSSGRELVDVAVHPSGELTILEASTAGWFLRRHDATGAKLGESLLHADIELVSHDAGRIVADGEDVFAGVRLKDHAVSAYRFAWSTAGFAELRTTLIVPPHAITPTGLIGGSYDTFGQLEHHYGVFVAVDASRMGYVAVSHQRLENGAMVKAHEKAFGEDLVTDADWLDAFVTRIDVAGTRLGTTVIGTTQDDQVYALRGGKSGAYAVGRTEQWNEQGTGFDAFVAHVDSAGKATVRSFDVSLGDIAFDALERADGSLVVVGTSGYSQNPHGASVSEEGQAFARVLHPNGTTSPIDLPSGPRHNEARFVVSQPEGSFVFGGMRDGPGTHSADGDASLLRASGWTARRR